MTSSPVLITLTNRDRAELQSLARARKVPLRTVQRAWIVLAAAAGQHNAQIARNLGLHVDTVRTWRGRFATDGMEGLADRPRTGRPPVFAAAVVAGVKALACSLPAEHGLPLSRWSCQDLADEAVTRGITGAVSGSTVRRWLDADAIKPWQHRSWIFPRDPDFAAKASRVLDLYDRHFEGRRLRPDEYVISADEKSQLQALRRRHPGLPPGPERTRRVEFEYSRGGTLAYFFVSPPKVKRTTVWATGPSKPMAVRTGEDSSLPVAQAEPLEQTMPRASSSRSLDRSPSMLDRACNWRVHLLGSTVMANLCIDFDALERVRANLADVEDLLKGPCRGMADLPSDAAGHDDLRTKLRDFGDEWDYGIGKLGDFTGGAADALTTIKDTFRIWTENWPRASKESQKRERRTGADNTMNYENLGFDPAPGDPDRGREMSRKLRQATNALAQMEDALSGTGNNDWEGRAATAFYGLVDDDLRPRVKDAYQSFSTASRALDRWLIDLEDYKGRADKLEIEAEDARRNLSSAQTSLTGLGEAPKDDPEALTVFQKQKTTHGDSVTDNQGVLDDVIRRARSLAGEASISATTTAGALKTAMDVAPDEPGLFDKIGDALEGIGEYLGDVIEFVKDNWWDLLHQLVSICATVLSIASIFFPGLAPFALAFVVVDMLMSARDMARGLPGAKEAFIGGALGLVGGFAVGKAVGSFMKVAGPSLATGPFRVIASGSTGAIAAPAAAVLAFNPTYGPALAGYLVIKAKDARDGSEAVASLIGGNTYYSNNLADGWRKARDN